MCTPVALHCTAGPFEALTDAPPVPTTTRSAGVLVCKCDVFCLSMEGGQQSDTGLQRDNQAHTHTYTHTHTRVSHSTTSHTHIHTHKSFPFFPFYYRWSFHSAASGLRARTHTHTNTRCTPASLHCLPSRDKRVSKTTIASKTVQLSLSIL